MHKIYVKWNDETVEEYSSVVEAEKAILLSFSETGSNLVADVWGEDTDGEETPLALTWNVAIGGR